MQVSFTGINNLYIGKKAYSEFGSYLLNNGNIKEGDRACLDVLIKCDLTDSKKGNHLSDFQNALKKVSSYCQADYTNPQKPQHVELLAHHVRVPDDKSALPFTVFKINGTEVVLDDPKVLPLYTYMAKLTREIAGLSKISDAQQAYARAVNKYVHDEAVYYIDYVM
ncbi:hypothetical protein J6A64_08050 [bacterium]|nr:hypothetical protein [bacterium]